MVLEAVAAFRTAYATHQSARPPPPPPLAHPPTCSRGCFLLAPLHVDGRHEGAKVHAVLLGQARHGRLVRAVAGQRAQHADRLQ